MLGSTSAQSKAVAPAARRDRAETSLGVKPYWRPRRVEARRRELVMAEGETAASAAGRGQYEASPGTPLYCEFLSPWVLRKELGHIIGDCNDIEQLLEPKWRNGRDIRATIWWNLIALFKRYELPFGFLLQGSFQNRLINPAPQDM